MWKLPLRRTAFGWDFDQTPLNKNSSFLNRNFFFVTRALVPIEFAIGSASLCWATRHLFLESIGLSVGLDSTLEFAIGPASLNWARRHARIRDRSRLTALD